ncbi:hypothetical protein SAMN05421543_102172 [Alicyclobacillus macrosporangiidus]|uniref:Uncharacterized protein n=1 Tax=Alicyclobacillus macrosporangiidus TaxID=392015 RepID=A0A1I7GF32_9BACL|nr:hypothetical protein SAMN05421543_102172 [Alicyclobacillus macrosporangiidus]
MSPILSVPDVCGHGSCGCRTRRMYCNPVDLAMPEIRHATAYTCSLQDWRTNADLRAQRQSGGRALAPSGVSGGGRQIAEKP